MSHAAGPGRAGEIRRLVTELLGQPGVRPLTAKAISRRLELSPNERGVLRGVVRDLLREGRLVVLAGTRLALAERFPQGVPAARGKRDRREDSGARPPSVVMPAGRPRPSLLLGVFRERERGGMVQPFDPKEGFRVLIPGSFRLGARDGEAVSVKVLRPYREGGASEGKIVETLGLLEEPGVDVKVVIRRHGLLEETGSPALEEAARLPGAVPEAESRRRERFEDPAPVTIDGETARDFDDAVAVAELPAGGFRLFVHIADVAAFVAPGSALDLEARSRGTSVYFPERVLPMFPEKLSNELCSLKPREDRLVQSVVMDIDASGELTGLRFADGVIRSAARLTYTQVAQIVEGAERVPGVPRGLVPMLRAADRLREVLETRRRARGSVDFDLPEPTILLDVEGVMTGITLRPRNRAHRMIEEFMLAANEAVAGFLAAHEAPCLYRVHEPPDPVKVQALADFAASFGLVLPVEGETLRPGAIQALLDQAEGKPEHPILCQVALRSMKQARYTATNRGHFGLAAPVYAHFTSPIRRYPDLVVHRLLRATRHGDRGALSRVTEELEGLGDACSRLERSAETAERELLDWKKIAFIKGRVGEVFEGMVTAVTPFGLFVQLPESLIEGLVHVERLGGDWFHFNESRLELAGAQSGAAYRIGDRLKVRLDRVDTVLRRVDFSLAESRAIEAPPARAGRVGRPAASRRRQDAAGHAAPHTRGKPKGRRRP